MIDVGTAPNSTNVAKIIVDPNFPNTLVVIGADQGPGTANGPSRKTTIFEDLTLRGNLDAGLVRGVKFHLHDGGIVPHMTGIPRISTEVSISEMSIIGAGRVDIPNVRLVKVYDNLMVANELDVDGITNLNGGASVMGAIDTTGDINAGSVGAWQTVRSQNMVYASGTFHLYDRGAGVVCKQCCGFGFDATLPVNFGMNVNYAPLAGFPPVVMVMLDRSIAQSVISVTPWMVAQYDETTPPGVLPQLVAWAAPPILQETHPYVTIKGAANPAGAIPTVNIAQQIEVFFATDDPIIPFIPTNGSPAVDLVFDITVAGYLVP